jgi:hypothetical protein
LINSQGEIDPLYFHTRNRSAGAVSCAIATLAQAGGLSRPELLRSRSSSIRGYLSRVRIPSSAQMLTQEYRPIGRPFSEYRFDVRLEVWQGLRGHDRLVISVVGSDLAEDHLEHPLTLIASHFGPVVND